MGVVLHVRAFRDNYIWLIPGSSGRYVAIVDPGDPYPVLDALHERKLVPAAIFCTHHHGDHSGGIEEIARNFPIPVFGPAGEAIAGVTDPVQEGQWIQVADLAAYRVIDMPGHTRGHVAYLGENRLFCGDTLFSAGCGRLFEGSAEQMYASLQKLAALPDTTEIYCAHEYTLANLRFAQFIEPHNPDIESYRQKATAELAQDKPSLPSTIALERRVNPFLRTQEPAVRRAVGASADPKSDTGTAVFGRLRCLKDDFAG